MEKSSENAYKVIKQGEDILKELIEESNIVTDNTKEVVEEIISENPLDEDNLRKAIGETGYAVTYVKTEPYVKKSHRK